MGAATWTRLKALVRELGLEDPQRPDGIVMRTKVDCLRVCQGGPVLLVWPEGIQYGGVTPDRVETIVREHVIGKRPVEDWIIQRWSFASDTSDNHR